MPRVKVRRLPRIDSRPRFIVNCPIACGELTGPVSRSDPPSSASSPRPCTKICCGALTVMSSDRPPLLPPVVAGFSAWSWARTGGRRVPVLHVELGKRTRQLFRDGDDRAPERDRARQERRRDQRSLDGQVARQGRGHDLPVGIAPVRDLDRQVGRKALPGIDADRAGRGERAARRQRAGEPRDRRAPRAERDVGRDVVDGDARARIDEAQAVGADAAFDDRRRGRAAHLQRYRRGARQGQALRGKPLGQEGERHGAVEIERKLRRAACRRPCRRPSSSGPTRRRRWRRSSAFRPRRCRSSGSTWRRNRPRRSGWSARRSSRSCS